jgi:hypothetical protein
MTALITEPGVYDIPASAYHRDPVAVPSLSSSVGKALLRSPRHGWNLHPRLNAAAAPENKKIFDLGRAAHALMTGADDNIAIIPAANYQTKTAQEAKAAAYIDERNPLLPHEHAELLTAAAAWRQQIAVSEAAGAFVPGLGRGERTLIWQEGDIWCRCRLDWQPNGGNIFPDLKSTTASAEPDDWSRSNLYGGGDGTRVGFEFQAAFYSRGIRALGLAADPQFKFLPAEIKAPHCLSVVQLPPQEAALADRKVEEAIQIWGWCLRNNRWPGYPSYTAYPQSPVYAQQRWLNREERQSLLSENGESLLKIAIDFQAPIPAIAPPKEDAA